MIREALDVYDAGISKLETTSLVRERAELMVKRDELRDLYDAADVGLFPIKKQGGVLAPLEVSCAKTPIIVSSEMETAPLIKKHDLGIVTRDYSKALLEIYNNQEKYKEKAKKTALFVKTNLSWKSFADKMIEAYMIAWKRNKK